MPSPSSSTVLESVAVTVVGAVTLGALGFAWRRGTHCVDQIRVARWLFANTKDEPGESHLEVSQIAAGVRLNEDRVLRACIASKRIHRSHQSPRLWSVWREEPRSVYETRGLLTL
jgi:hypothetical protein